MYSGSPRLHEAAVPPVFEKCVRRGNILFKKKCLKHIYFILMPFCFKLSGDQMYLNTIFLILDLCVVLESYIYILVIGYLNILLYRRSNLVGDRMSMKARSTWSLLLLLLVRLTTCDPYGSGCLPIIPRLVASFCLMIMRKFQCSFRT